MGKFFKWLVIAALVVVVLLGAVFFMLHRWVHTDDFRERAERQASAALGVPVTLSRVAVDVWPLPAIAVSGITVQSKPVLTVGRIEVRPLWRPLLSGRIEVATLLVRRAELPQQAIDGLLLLAQKKKPVPVPAAVSPAAAASSPDGLAGWLPSMDRVSWWPRRTVLDDISWVSVTGARSTLQGEARLSDDGLPESVSLKLLQGHLQGLTARLDREAQELPDSTAGVPANTAAPAATAATGIAGSGQWVLRVEVGGGRIEGKIGLQHVRSAGGRAPDELALQGRLQTSDVEVSALTAPARVLTGQLEALTNLTARSATTSGLVEALQSQTSFTVRGAVLHGLDLVKAVQTVGLSRGGETALDTLSGEAATQGRSVQVGNVVATSGILSATGNLGLSPAKALSGSLDVTVKGDSKIVTALGGAVAVPLVVGGTLDSPELTLSRTALIGAAIGTAVMPGVGTGVGAKVGERIGKSLRELVGK